MRVLIELFVISFLLLPALTRADIHHNYPNISIEADGDNGDVSLVSKGTGVVNSVGDVKIQASGKHFQRYPGVYVTPVAAATARGAAILSEEVSVVAAAAPTANFVQLKDVDVNLGKSYSVWNRSPTYPVAIFPQDADAINAAAVGTPYACPATKVCECEAVLPALAVCTNK